MPIYKVQGPDGKTYTVEGPAGASASDLEAHITSQPSYKAAVDPQQALVESQGPLDTLGIAAGRTFDRIGAGIKQAISSSSADKMSAGNLLSGVPGIGMALKALAAGQKMAGLEPQAQAYSDRLRQEQQGATEAYAPLKKASPVLTGLGEALPAMIAAGPAAVTSLTGAATAGLLGGGLPELASYGTPEERLKRGAEEGGIGLLGGAAGYGAGKLLVKGVRGIKSLAEPFMKSGQDAIVGRALNTAAGGGKFADDAMANLRGAQELVPGSMRRPPGVVVVLPGVGAGLDGGEVVTALGVGDGPTGAGEAGVERRRPGVLRVGVAPGGVGLPELDQGVRHRPAVAVEHPPGNDDPLPDRLGSTVRGEVGIAREQSLGAEHRPGQLAEAVREQDEGPGRHAQDGRGVGRCQ